MSLLADPSSTKHVYKKAVCYLFSQSLFNSRTPHVFDRNKQWKFYSDQSRETDEAIETSLRTPIRLTYTAKRRLLAGFVIFFLPFAKKLFYICFLEITGVIIQVFWRRIFNRPAMICLLLKAYWIAIKILHGCRS